MLHRLIETAPFLRPYRVQMGDYFRLRRHSPRIVVTIDGATPV